jgi:polar amino acid transport system substrate-binding protein
VLISVREALQYYYAPKLPGSRVLDQNFGFNPMAIALPKGQAARLAYINEFVADAKASGFLQDVINRLGRQATIRVAPAEKRR